MKGSVATGAVRTPELRWLFGICVLALGARLAHALAAGTDVRGDAGFYQSVARALADGEGYADPIATVAGHAQPTALHPPLFPVYLAAWNALGIDSVRGHQVASCLLGTASVLLIWAAGRRLAGGRVGLIAAGLAAGYPPLLLLDQSMNSESLYVMLIALVLLLAYRLLDDPSARRAAALGAAIGLATLTRSDAVLLLPLLLIPLIPHLRRGWLRMSAVATATAAVVVAPWIVRNWVAFDKVPLLSTNGGYTARATNCDDTYHRPSLIGFVSHSCGSQSSCFRRFPVAAVLSGRSTEVARDECLQEEATRYVRAHLTRTPLVALTRVERVWEIYGARANIDYGSFLWGRPRPLATAALVAYGLVATLAVAGAHLLGTMSRSRIPLFAMLAQATLVAALAFGFTRYRAAAEPALVVLAAVTLDRLIRRRSPRRGEPQHG